MLCLTLLAGLFIHAAVSAPAALNLVTLTWNTEYYYPKNGDLRVLLDANAMTEEAVCNADAVVLLFQEVEHKYLDAKVCVPTKNHRKTPEAKAAIKLANTHSSAFDNFRRGLRRMFERCRPPKLSDEEILKLSENGIDVRTRLNEGEDVSDEALAAWENGETSTRELTEEEQNRARDILGFNVNKDGTKPRIVWNEDCTIMTGTFGTKGLNLNSQAAYVFHRSTYEAQTISVSTSKTEKGAVAVVLNPVGHPDNRAVVVGVHLDAKTDDKRNKQIHEIFAKLLQRAAPCPKGQKSVPADEEADGPACVKNAKEDCLLGEMRVSTKCKPASLAVLAEQLQELFPVGVYLTGDSNYRLPGSAFGTDHQAYVQMMAALPKKAKDKAPIVEKLLLGVKTQIVKTLVNLACEGEAGPAYSSLLNADTAALQQSALIQMGFSINKPYPALPPSYPWVDVQPCTLTPTIKGKGMLGGKTKQKLPKKRDAILSAKSQHLADFVAKWGECKDGGKGAGDALKAAIEVVMEHSLGEHEALRWKMEDAPHPVLNIGYLDRLFILSAAGVTVTRELVLQALVYGGDHLPQLYVTRTNYDGKTVGLPDESATVDTSAEDVAVKFEVSNHHEFTAGRIFISDDFNKKYDGNPGFQSISFRTEGRNTPTGHARLQRSNAQGRLVPQSRDLESSTSSVAIDQDLIPSHIKHSSGGAMGIDLRESPDADPLEPTSV